jgi:hypothetical protein
MDEKQDVEQAPMGVTSTPDSDGAAAIDEPGNANGSAVGLYDGSATDPDESPNPDEPVHRSPRYSHGN